MKYNNQQIVNRIVTVMDAIKIKLFKQQERINNGTDKNSASVRHQIGRASCLFGSYKRDAYFQPRRADGFNLHANPRLRRYRH